jgi:hypothetical protein
MDVVMMENERNETFVIPASTHVLLILSLPTNDPEQQLGNWIERKRESS